MRAQPEAFQGHGLSVPRCELQTFLQGGQCVAGSSEAEFEFRQSGPAETELRRLVDCLTRRVPGFFQIALRLLIVRLRQEEG